jgi:diguanylate cyclase (GGDEF)-like protein
MLTQNIYYQEERKYASERFVAIVVLTLLAFVVAGQTNDVLAEKVVLSGFILLVLLIFSVVHYYFISTFPGTMVSIRKNALILADLGVLTYLIISFESNGLFLFPFYILIVMRSGLSFGTGFFYSGLILAGISWVALLLYSPYWEEHSDIIATFAMTTLLMPMFYLKFIDRIHEENHELSQSLNEPDFEVSYDELTGVPNRKQYKERMMELIHEKEPFALLFFDLNKFKAINDTHGHHVGDEVLKEVARRLSENLEGDDFLARLGGDEFVIITKRDRAYMDKFLAKLKRSVIGRHKVGNIYVPIELSIGVSYFPDDNRTAVMLAKFADEAMYTAKKDPERCHYYYHELTDEQKEENQNR